MKIGRWTERDNGHNWTSVDKIGHYGAKLEDGHKWTMDTIEDQWTQLDDGHNCLLVDTIEHLWTKLYISGHNWTSMDIIVH